MISWRAVMETHAPEWTILVRWWALSSSSRKAFRSLFSPTCWVRGALPTFPDLMGPFVGTVDITCGALIILGLLTRLAAVPLIIIMLVAIVSTKVPIWLGHDFWIFHVPKLARYGVWSMAHEARADFCMLLGSLYLLIEGGGRWSIDAALAGQRRR